MARICGAEITRVTIVDDEKTWGRVSYDMPYRDMHWHRYACAFAGPYSSRWTGDETLGCRGGDPDSDIGRMDDCINKISEAEGADGLVGRIRDWEAKCESVLWLLEKQVMALAKELLKRKTMSGAEVEAFLAEYSKQKELETTHG